MKKILVLGLLLIVVVSGLGVWGYVMGSYRSNTRVVNIGTQDNVEVLFSIPNDTAILIPYNAIPSKENETTQLDIQVYVSAVDTQTFRILKLPQGFSIIGWSENAQYQTNKWVDLKLILTEPMQTSTYNIYIEIELV